MDNKILKMNKDRDTYYAQIRFLFLRYSHFFWGIPSDLSLHHLIALISPEIPYCKPLFMNAIYWNIVSSRYSTYLYEQNIDFYHRMSFIPKSMRVISYFQYFKIITALSLIFGMSRVQRRNFINRVCLFSTIFCSKIRKFFFYY